MFARTYVLALSFVLFAAVPGNSSRGILKDSYGEQRLSASLMKGLLCSKEEGCTADLNCPEILAVSSDGTATSYRNVHAVVIEEPALELDVEDSMLGLRFRDLGMDGIVDVVENMGEAYPQFKLFADLPLQTRDETEKQYGSDEELIARCLRLREGNGPI